MQISLSDDGLVACSSTGHMERGLKNCLGTSCAVISSYIVQRLL